MPGSKERGGGFTSRVMYVVVRDFGGNFFSFYHLSSTEFHEEELHQL